MLFLSTCCVCSSSFLWNPIRTPAEAISHTASDINELGNQNRSTLANLLKEPNKVGMSLLVFSMTLGGLSLATFGLGLQADHRRAAVGATITCIIMLLVLILSGIGLWSPPRTSITVRLWHAGLSVLIVITLGFILAAWRQVQKDPPPVDVDILPPDAKIPYNMYHDDPPEVRLANEIAARRRKLEAEQAELDKMEQQLNEDKESSS